MDAGFTEFLFSLSIPLTLVVLNHEYSPFFFRSFPPQPNSTIYDCSSMCSQIDPKIALGQMQANMWPRPLDGFGIVPLSRKKMISYFRKKSDENIPRIYEIQSHTTSVLFSSYFFIFLLLIHSYNLICRLCI